MNSAIDDRLAIRELIENWVVWRDAGDWERFRSVWSKGGQMEATWKQGSAEEFIQASIEGWSKGVNILHFLGGASIDIAGDRAIAQTKMTISQRGFVDDVLCDVVCTGRFFDFVVREEGQWRIRLRQPIYEKDRLDVVDPGVALTLDEQLLNSFPAGYRHLAYLQTRLGYEVKRTMPGIRGPEVETLYARGRDWLSGNSLQESVS
jgi:hypothetical protein